MRRFFPVSAALLTVACFAFAENGPNGGALYEGAKHKFHAELKVDAKLQTATVYILDNKAQKQVPIPAKNLAMILKGTSAPIVFDAVPSKTDTKLASVFTAKDKRFATALKFEEIEFRFVVDNSGKIHTFQYEE